MPAARGGAGAVLGLRQPPDSYAIKARHSFTRYSHRLPQLPRRPVLSRSTVRSQLASLGYFGLRIPERYGGVGLTLTEYLGVVRGPRRTNLRFRS